MSFWITADHTEECQFIKTTCFFH